MRTLHKGLAMLLVVIMVLGLGAFTVVAAPSDIYADAGEISETYKEAVDVLTYIGVLEGDNGFRPQDTLTRAEGAKILTAVMGVLNPTGTATTFTDVDDWAKGYVAYVEVNGISDGVAENLFGSQMKLTGSMFAKWLLVGLGYDAETEGMTGIPWEINIAKLVRVTGLDAGLQDYDPTKEITREQAAHMALNALQTTMVNYNLNVTVNTATDGTISVSGNATYVNGGTEAARNNIRNNERIELGERYWKNLKLEGNNDKMGRPTRVWNYSNKEIGTYLRHSDVIASYTKAVGTKDLHDVVGRSDYQHLKNGDLGYSMTAYVDGDPTIVSNANIGSYLTPTKPAQPSNAPSSGNGVLTELYRFEDGSDVTYTLVTMHTFLLKATADYSESAKSVKVTSYGLNEQNTLINGTLNITEIKQQDFDVSNVLKDEYLLVTAYKDGPGYKVQSVEPATVLTGEVESYTASKNNQSGEVTSKVKIDGTEYSYNALIGSVDNDHEGLVEFSVGRNATVVLDKYGYIIYVEEADAGFDARYVYVKEAAYSLGLKARAYFLDGTTQDIDVKKVGINVAAAAHGTPGNGSYIGGQWWSYTTDDSGRYTLKVDGTKDAVGTYTVNYTDPDHVVSTKNTVKFLNRAPAGTDKTILVVLYDEEITTYQGAADMPKIDVTGSSATVSYLTDKAGTYTKYVFIDGSSATLNIEGGARNEDILFVLDNTSGGTGSDSKTGTYKQVDVVLNGVKKEKMLVEEQYASNLTVGQTYTNLKYNDAGWLKRADLIKSTGKEYASLGNDNVINPISATSNTLYVGTVALNVTNANVNLIVGAQALGNPKINTDYLSTSASAVAKYLTDKNYTDQYDYFVVYSADPDSNHNGIAKAVYIYLHPGVQSTVNSTARLMSDLNTNRTVNFTGTINSDTKLTVYPGQVLNITSGSIIGTDIDNYGTINVSGTGTLNVAGSTTVNNYGTVNVNGGTLTVDGSTTWNEHSANSLHIRSGATVSGNFGTLNVKPGAQVEIAKSGITIENLTIDATATVKVTEDVTVQTATVNGTITVGNGADVEVSTTLQGSGSITAADNTDVSVTVTGDNNSSITSELVGYGGTLTITGSGFVSSNPSPDAGTTYTISADANTTSIVITVDDTAAAALKSAEGAMQSAIATASGLKGAVATIAVNETAKTVTITINNKNSTAKWALTLTISGTVGIS